jgi:ankyrin repeat protein
MVESDKYNMASPTQAAVPPVVPIPPVNVSKLECDYDLNPTVLYQAIEAKQWDYAVSLFTTHKQGEQSATWVVRKETNGKLRWRLLPLHAAVIFGSPLKLVELLLADYPTAAHCKDDQGMLPLHLAFRNESSFDVIEELLTAFPQACFVSDRKARTPLQCGTTLGRSSNSSVGSNSNYPDHQSKSFKSVVSVLDLFSQIAVSGERQVAQQEARKMAEASTSRLQDSHLQTLTTLKKEWNTQQEESKRQVVQLEKEKRALEERVKAQEIDIHVSRSTENDLAAKLKHLTLALNEKNHPAITQTQMTNDLLRAMIDDLVEQQKDYHQQFNNLMSKYGKLVDERKEVQAVFFKESTTLAEKEQKVVNGFKKWLSDKEKKLHQQEASLEEEKKVEDAIDFVERTTEQSTKMPPRKRVILSPSSSSTHTNEANIIDLSDVAPDDSS